MPLEASSYISGLNAANPASTDSARQGDDHIRLIKSVLKSTFPSLDGPVTRTPAQMNYPVPIGCILVWYGSTASVPTGFGICDGTTYTRTDGAGTIISPDLRSKYVQGVPALGTPGTAVGATSKTSSIDGYHTHTASEQYAGAHTHGGATGSHALTLTEIPAHSHFSVANRSTDTPSAAAVDSGTLQDLTATTYVAEYLKNAADYDYHLRGHPNVPNVGPTSSSGGSGGHTHSISQDGSHVHNTSLGATGNHSHTVDVTPPSLQLHFIMKI